MSDEPQTKHRLDYATPMPRPRLFARGVFGWVLFIGLAVMLFVLLKTSQANVADISLDNFEQQLLSNNVSSVRLDADELTGFFVTPPRGLPGMTKFRATLPQGLSGNWSFVEWLLDNRGPATITATNSQNVLLQVILPFIPWLLIFGAVWFFLFRQLRKNAGHAPRPTPVVIVDPSKEGAT